MGSLRAGGSAGRLFGGGTGRLGSGRFGSGLLGSGRVGAVACGRSLRGSGALGRVGSGRFGSGGLASGRLFGVAGWFGECPSYNRRVVPGRQEATTAIQESRYSEWNSEGVRQYNRNPLGDYRRDRHNG